MTATMTVTGGGGVSSHFPVSVHKSQSQTRREESELITTFIYEIENAPVLKRCYTYKLSNHNKCDFH